MDRNATENHLYSYIYILKALAIFSVVSAHSNSLNKDVSDIAVYLSILMQNIGTIGVAIFFIISGYLFHKKKYTLKQFAKSRLKTIFIPWIFSGTTVYLYVYLRKGGLSIHSWIDFIVGNGSYLYYLSVLCVLYMIGYFIPFNRRSFLVTGVALSLASLFITSSDIIKLPFVSYLNIFNWLIYFLCGLYLQTENRMQQVYNHLKKYFFVYCIVYLIFLSIKVYFKSGGDYWNGSLNVINTWIGVFAFSSLAILLNEKYFLRSKTSFIGVASFFIYIWHMPLSGVLVNLSNRYYNGILCATIPFLVIALMLIIIMLFQRVLSKFGDHFLFTLIGFPKHIRGSL